MKEKDVRERVCPGIILGHPRTFPKATAVLPDLRLILCLTPHGRLLLSPSEDAPALEPGLGERVGGPSRAGLDMGFLRLGAAEVGQIVHRSSHTGANSPVASSPRSAPDLILTSRVGSRRALLGADHRGKAWKPFRVSIPTAGGAAAAARGHCDAGRRRAGDAGAEYLTTDILTALWTEIGAASFGAELTEAKASLQEFLKNLHPAWNVVGKVHFNLAENRKDEAAPFAFLATYTHRLSPHGKASTCRSGRPCARTRARAASKSCCRSCCRSSARRNPARG